MRYERTGGGDHRRFPRPSEVGSQLILLVGLPSLVLCSCSLVMDPEPVQCSIDQDCTRKGGSFSDSLCIDHFCQPPGPWDCLGRVVWSSSVPGDVTVTMNLVDLVTSLPVPGLSAQVCHKLDTACTSPVVRDLVSDPSGQLTFDVQAGFDGYLESTAAGIMPFLYFFYPPLSTDRNVPSVPILQDTGLAVFAKLAGGNASPERGHLMARAYNCLGRTAEAVRFSSPESDGSTVPFYMVKGIPSINQSETDSSGNGGLLNLPPGTATLTGRLANGEATGTLSTVTAAGRITYTALVPSPR